MKITVYTRKDGTVEARAYHKGKRFSKYAQDEATAKYKLKIYLEDIGIFIPDTDELRTLGLWLQEWFEVYKKPKLKATSIRNIENTIRLHISEKLKNKPLVYLSALDIQKDLNKIKYPRCKKYVFDVLKGALGKAFNLGYTKKNIMLAVDTVRQESKSGVPLSIEERKLFIEKIKQSKYRNIFLFYLYTGCRRNEALSVRWKDVDFKKELILIRGTKTKTSYRTIPLFEGAKLSLLEQKNISGKDTYVFNFTPCQIDKAFKKLFPTHHLHDLRHTFATICAEYGISIKVAQNWLGHSSYLTTAKIYTHALNDFQVNEAKKFPLLE